MWLRASLRTVAIGLGFLFPFFSFFLWVLCYVEGSTPACLLRAELLQFECRGPHFNVNSSYTITPSYFLLSQLDVVLTLRYLMQSSITLGFFTIRYFRYSKVT